MTYVESCIKRTKIVLCIVPIAIICVVAYDAYKKR